MLNQLHYTISWTKHVSSGVG